MPDEVPFLNTLADALCQEVAGGGPNRLVHLKEAGDGYDVGLLPLDGAHPVASCSARWRRRSGSRWASPPGAALTTSAATAGGSCRRRPLAR